VLYRVFAFDWTDAAARAEPLAIPRQRQGSGRHDNPDFYTALYVAREPVSAVAEFLQAFRGQTIGAGAFDRSDGRAMTLATLADEALPALVDLDDPATLVQIGRRPSAIATGVRATTQRMALDRFENDAAGLSWWSTLEASWTNVTLFDVRLPAMLEVVEIDRLHVAHAVVIAAAERLSVGLRT
jgi:hypothetical protein